MSSLQLMIAEQLDERGFVIVPDVLASETVEKVGAAIQSVLNLNNDRRAAHGDHAMRHLLQSVPEVKALAESAAVRELVEPILGASCFVVRGIFFDKTEAANWKVAWHQDLTIAVAERIDVPGFTSWSVKDGVVHAQPPAALLERMLTVRLHLDNCGNGNGPLQVIPGSHKSGRLDLESIARWKRRQRPVVCAVPRGGAVLMRPLLLHASSAADRPNHRRVVHLEFAAENLPNSLRWA